MNVKTLRIRKTLTLRGKKQNGTETIGRAGLGQRIWLKNAGERISRPLYDFRSVKSFQSHQSDPNHKQSCSSRHRGKTLDLSGRASFGASDLTNPHRGTTAFNAPLTGRPDQSWCVIAKGAGVP